MLKNCLIVLMLFPLVLNVLSYVYLTVVMIVPNSWIPTLLFNKLHSNDMRAYFDLIIKYQKTEQMQKNRLFAIMLQCLILCSALVVLKKNITKFYFRVSLVVQFSFVALAIILLFVNLIGKFAFASITACDYFQREFVLTIDNGSLNTLADYMTRSRCCGFYNNHDLIIDEAYYPSACNGTQINRGCYQTYLTNYEQEHNLFTNVFFQQNFLVGFAILMQGFVTVFAVILYKNWTYPLPPLAETIETPAESIIESYHAPFRRRSYDRSSDEQSDDYRLQFI